MEKEKYLEILNSLGSAGSEIIKRYGQKRELSDSSYQSQLDGAAKERDLEKSEAAAAARISQLNTDASLASQGLGRSGESVQARLMNDMTKNAAFENAADRYDENVRRINEEKRQDELNAQSALAKELTGLAKDLYEADYRERRDQRDDELAEKKFELEKKKTDNDISLKNYLSQKALDDLKAGYESEIAELEKALSDSGLILSDGQVKFSKTYKPDKKANEVYKGILNTANLDAGGGWGKTADPVLYRELVQSALGEILNDPYLDENYKASIRFYARTDGFID